jgi:hypothetical protein
MKRILVASICLVACGSSSNWGDSQSSTSSDLSGCHGTASSSQPSDGDYYLTSFGFTSSDDGIMSCGEYTKDGSWYYAASRQRFGCGSRIQIEANGKCVVAETDDYGPDVCVESAAGKPIIDASPLVSEHLFGTKSAGWSDRYAIHVTQVDGSTPLGPCDSSSPPPPPPPPQSVTCYSHTLGQDEPEGTCVQSSSDNVWYQCTANGWVSGVDGDNGPIGACTAEYPL